MYRPPYLELLQTIRSAADSSHWPLEFDAHVEDSVESRWMERATAGAFLDVVIAAGVALTLTSLLDLDVPGRLVLLGLLGGAGADTALRYRVLSRREA